MTTETKQEAVNPAKEDNTPLLRLDRIGKVFLTDELETHALSDVDLEIEKGEYVSIAGPSGCGKSTLLSLLGLLDTPSSGTYTLNGESVENLSYRKRARTRNREIGIIFQSFNLIGDLTVAENVEFLYSWHRWKSDQRLLLAQYSSSLSVLGALGFLCTGCGRRIQRFWIFYMPPSFYLTWDGAHISYRYSCTLHSSGSFHRPSFWKFCSSMP